MFQSVCSLLKLETLMVENPKVQSSLYIKNQKY